MYKFTTRTEVGLFFLFLKKIRMISSLPLDRSFVCVHAFAVVVREAQPAGTGAGGGLWCEGTLA